MKLTVAGKTAMQALLDLVQNSKGNPVSVKDIASRQNISLYFLEQLFRRLRISKIVKSIRGPGGGYVLARQPNVISLKDILNGVGERTSLLGKVEIGSAGTKEEQAVTRLLKEADSALESLLENFTLEDLQSESDISNGQ